ncbi:hypothetical protein Nepgr_020081 [Nepenthes gracilis]|uniref:Uncharacterized protein n=1 Tax=Nepenthes gracilis TaxID=150966 RepID=A0AAD3XVU1_NEPGR|nr:hypothetical protein Nepgr_020081 [Nepenthes gracilis]
MRNRHLQRKEIDYVLNPPFRMFSARLSARTRRDKASEKRRENSQARVSNNQATHKTSPSGGRREPSNRRNSDRSLAGSIADSIIFERFAKELYSVIRLLLMFPTHVTHQEFLEAKVNETKETVKFQLKKVLCMGVAVEMAKMEEKDISKCSAECQLPSLIVEEKLAKCVISCACHCRYQGLGIRVEDQVLITETGYEELLFCKVASQPAANATRPTTIPIREQPVAQKSSCCS